MEIKKSHFINTQSTDRKKEERTPPKRSFHEAMISRKIPRQDQKKPSLFDVTSKKEKEEKKEVSSQRKEEANHVPQHGEVQEILTTIVAGETLSTTSISELTPEMTDLMEKMKDFILVESQNGKTTTTVVIEMKGSVLDGAQIIMDHYDTAPHSFNLQLSGSPESLDLFTAHLATLQSSLETHQALQGFHVHILPPTLNEKSDLHIRGKEKKGRVKGKEKATRVAYKKKISF
ncbi:MAG: hypothetical protein P0S93_00770 [Candidatus Neptunochlamydia sp.]|nr:hypothetical protein [Candidatus Neptunochlamydia sp.]